MYKIKTLNEIAPVWAEALPEGEYTVRADAENPDAVIVRSFVMHEYPLAENTLAVARAGVGVNNIPLNAYAEKGVVVFNSPGANANAVKELVIAGLLIASRDIVGSANWAQSLKGQGEQVEKLVEKGKQAFAGPELRGKKLGVIGLGAVGLLVANAGAALGMEVLGYDPYISVDHAWMLSRAVRHALSEDEIYSSCDYVTVHTPLTEETRHKFNKAVFDRMKDGCALLNFSRGELVMPEDVKNALLCGKLRKYVSDFPTDALLGVQNVICLPHIGASTPESEDNCVRMAARQIDGYLKTGAIENSVNYPNADPGRVQSPRLVVLHQNVPNVVNSITALISARNINIENMLNKSRGKYAYTALDLGEAPSDELTAQIAALSTVYRARVILP